MSARPGRYSDLTAWTHSGDCEQVMALDRKILQHVHDSWRKTLAGPEKRTCDVVGELAPTLQPWERTLLAETLTSLVLRGWLRKHADNFFEATDAGEYELAK